MKLKMTKSNYLELVARLESAQPTHPFLSDMKAGHTRFTELFLERALKEMPLGKPKVVVKTLQNVEETKDRTATHRASSEADDNKDDYADDLAQRMNHLIGAKRSMSNQFFGVQNDPKKCKELSVKILTYETDIEDLRDQLRYYHQYKKPRPDADDSVDAFNLPSTKFELDKRLRSIRTMICQVQDEIEAAALGGDKKRVQEREKRLFTLKNQRDVANQKLQQATV